MVKCHRSNGKPRQYAKHQKIHDFTDPAPRCGTCLHIGHAGGLNARMFPWACFCKDSKHYMRNVYRSSLPCSRYSRNTRTD